MNAMPFYKLVCRGCGHTFEKRASVVQRAERRIACPACGGTSLENDYAAGSASIHLKAECPHRQGAAPAGGCTGGCGCGGCRGAGR